MKYIDEERARHEAAFDRLCKIITSKEPDSEEFRCALDEALAAGFLIDFLDESSGTLLHCTIYYNVGLLQAIVDSGGDVNIKYDNVRPPLGYACSEYIRSGRPECLKVINLLFEGGADPGLDESWKKGWTGPEWSKPEQRARRDWLEAYIESWTTRRRAVDVSPAFDYAL